MARDEERYTEQQDHREPPLGPWRENHQSDSLDVAYGGLNLAAKGSIIVLALMLAGNAWFTFKTYEWLKVQINEVVTTQNADLAKILETQHKHRGEQGSEYRALDGGIIRNRDYLRETARVCMYTEQQKLKFQSRLTPAMMELLFNEREQR